MSLDLPDCHRWNMLCCEAQGGDAAALVKLMVETRPLLVAQARRYRQQMQNCDVENVVQATQLSFFRSLERIDHRGPCGLLLVILYRVINRLAERQDRTRGTQSIGPADDTDGGSGFEPSDEDMLTPEAEVSLDETRASVRDCVNSLPEDQREAIQLRFFEDMSYSEAAEVMGRTLLQFKNLLSKARRTLEERLNRLNL
jgi:RNA polymerase sigma factor (sigma-70 family)